MTCAICQRAFEPVLSADQLAERTLPFEGRFSTREAAVEYYHGLCPACVLREAAKAISLGTLVTDALAVDRG